MFGFTDNEKLIKAAKTGDLDRVIQLVERDYTDVNAGREDSGRKTPLYVALENKHWDVADYLLQYQETLFPAFMMAGKCNNMDVVKYFIEDKKIDVNYQKNMSYPTLLHLAVKHNYMSLCEYLLLCGADVDRKQFVEPDENVEFMITAYQLALKYNREKMINMMKRHERGLKIGHMPPDEETNGADSKQPEMTKTEQGLVPKSPKKRREEAFRLVKKMNDSSDNVQKLAMIGELCQILKAGDYNEAKTLYAEIEPKIDKIYHQRLQNMICKQR